MKSLALKRGPTSRLALPLILAVVCLITLFACCSCAMDSRTPSEKLMEYMAENGGSGSADSSVKVQLPTTDSDASCDLTMTPELITLEYTDKSAGDISATATSGIDPLYTTSVEVSYTKNTAQLLQKNSLTVVGMNATSQANGKFEPKTYTNGQTVSLSDFTSSLGSANTGITPAFQQTANDGVGNALTCLKAYLEDSETGLTMADFGFEKF